MTTTAETIKKMFRFKKREPEKEAEIKEFLQTYIQLIKEELVLNGEFKMMDIGCFKLKKYKGKTNFKNPKSGEIIESTGDYVKLSFHPYPNFKKQLKKELLND